MAATVSIKNAGQMLNDLSHDACAPSMYPTPPTLLTPSTSQTHNPQTHPTHPFGPHCLTTATPPTRRRGGAMDEGGSAARRRVLAAFGTGESTAPSRSLAVLNVKLNFSSAPSHHLVHHLYPKLSSALSARLQAITLSTIFTRNSARLQAHASHGARPRGGPRSGDVQVIPKVGLPAWVVEGLPALGRAAVVDATRHLLTPSPPLEPCSTTVTPTIPTPNSPARRVPFPSPSTPFTGSLAIWMFASSTQTTHSTPATTTMAGFPCSADG